MSPVDVAETAANRIQASLTVNDSRPGGAYGYVHMGGWIGGQARFVMVPYADFNLLKFPDRDKALAKFAT